MSQPLQSKSSSSCKPNKIINPSTNRCIDEEGRTAKKLKKNFPESFAFPSSSSSSSSSSSKQTNLPRSHNIFRYLEEEQKPVLKKN